MPHCCSWLDFITAVRERWRPEWGDIDVHKPRVAWGKYCATPAEFLRKHGHVPQQSPVSEPKEPT